MERTLQVLLLSDQTALRGEVESASRDLPGEMGLAIHTESDRRRGIEHALNRLPDLVLLDLADDVAEALRTAAEISRGASETKVVAVYRPDVLGAEATSTSFLIELMRAGVKDFLRRPVSGNELEELLRRQFWSADREKARRGRVVSFLGNKGGVGKSTVSLGVACGLARRAPGRVLLVDASLQHGAMCELLGVVPDATISDAARQIDRLDERLLRMFSVSHESGLRVLAAPPNAIDAAPVDDLALARILSVARLAFDYVVVDTFPLVDGVTVAILDVADLVFVVLNEFVPAVLGTHELLAVLERIGVSSERIRVVLNHTTPRYRGRLPEADVAARLRHDIDFVVPYSRSMLASANTGDPYALRAPRWRGIGKALASIEEEILGWKAGPATAGASLPEPAEPDEPDEEGRAGEGLLEQQRVEEADPFATDGLRAPEGA